MKTLYPLFLLAFLVFQVQSKPDPPDEIRRKGNEIRELAGLKEGDKGLKDEAAAQFRGLREPCFHQNGYCLPRIFGCASGFMFKEQYNTCYDKKFNKCCVP